MISLLIKLYRRNQMLKLYKNWNNNAIIGEMFELGSTGAVIYNESGEKDRIRIGHHTRINGSIICKASGEVEIGNYSVLQNHASVACLKHIKIGNYVGIADGTIITDNNNHRIEPEERVKHRLRVAPGGEGYPGLGNGWELSESTSSPTIIEDVVWIGSYSAIMKGVTVGEGALVARNSVVTKDVPPYTIVAGNPARIVKEIPKPKQKYYDI